MWGKDNLNKCSISLVIVLCAGAGASISDKYFLANVDWEHWNILTSNDIKQFVIENFKDNYGRFSKLANATSGIIPEINKADCPLNHFVGVQQLNHSIWQEMLDAATNTIVRTKDEIEVSELLKIIMKDLHPLLDDATQARLKILTKLKRDRIEEEYQPMVKKLSMVVEQVLTNESDDDNILPSIMQELRTINIAKEVLDVLSFPVVREEVRLAISANAGAKDLTPKIMEKFGPFLYEGISRLDNAIIQKHTDEMAQQTLERALINLYKHLFEEAVLSAKQVDEFLTKDQLKDNGEMGKSETVRKIIENEFKVPTRRAISLYYTFVKRMEPETVIPCDYKRVPENIRAVLQTSFGILSSWVEQQDRIKKVLKEKLGFNDTFQRCDIRTAAVFTAWIDHLERELDLLIRSECESHKKQHEAFTKENKLSDMVQSIDRLLEIKHKAIKESDISILREEFDGFPHYLELHPSVHDHPEILRQFQGDIENEATHTYNFEPGMFIYSLTYFDLLDKISSTRNSSNTKTKQEL